jgi:putative ABC transport system permease protein
MFRLALRTLRFRAGGFAATFVTLFFGGIIVLSCGGLMETGIRTAAPPQRLAAAPVVVTGNQDFPERARLDAGLVTKVEQVPGVAKAVPDISFPATLVRDDRPVSGALTGHGWASAELAPYSVVSGAAPARPGEVVLDAAYAKRAGVGVGDTVGLAAGGDLDDFRVTGVATSTAFPSVFFADADARRLSGMPDRIDSIGVLAEPGTDIAKLQTGIEAALSGTPVSVLTGDDRGLAEFDGVQAGGTTLIATAAVFGGLAVMVAVFVVASTLALSIQQRQREMALLRAIGATPGQVRRLVIGEAMVVGVLATALAYIPNVSVGKWLLGQFAAKDVVPSVIAYRQGWLPTAAAIGIALLTAMGAAHIAGRGAARARPTDALAEASGPRHWLSWTRMLFALLCLGGGAALAFLTATVMSGPVAASTAGPTALLLASGLALLSPGIARVLTALLRWPLRALSGQAGHLAMQNASARRLRIAAATTPIMLATGLATAFLYMQTTQKSASEHVYTENLRADAVLTSTIGGFSVDAVRAVASAPGVAAASAMVPSSGYFPTGDPRDPVTDDDVAVLGVTAAGAAETTATQVTAGSLADLDGQTVALSNERATRVGDTVTMRLGDGAETKLRVVALLATRPGYETALLPASLVAQHTTSRLVPQILVRAAPGADLAALADRLPGLRVANRDQILAGQAKQEQTGTWVNYLLVAMILGYTVIALVNTLVIATGERRREFALQRLIGSTRGQIMRMMTVETVLVVVSGVLLGTAVAAVTLIAFGMALTGSPTPQGPLWIYGTVTGAAALLAITATLVTAWVVLRPRPIEAAAP